ncbi:MAG: transcriptional regulator [Chloroflexi bacterium HGW-Chloroflexi-6]|nr:MAG: transcriptional regulator [Chloroflexi bacterium HGW-Chloroflexi-6]
MQISAYVIIRIYKCFNRSENIMISQTLAQEVSQLEADLCFALADPTRILMLYALDEHPRNVTELTQELNITQPTASRHLKILRDRGLVQPNRQGVVIQYELNDRRLIQALDLLRSVLRDRLAYRANLMEEINETE